LGRSMEEIERTVVEFMGSVRNSASEQAGALVEHIHGLGREGTWQGDSDAGGEAFGGYKRFKPGELELEYNSRREKALAMGNGQAAAPAAEKDVTAADGTRPEVEGMQQVLLEAGGKQIVELLEAMYAEMAAVECTQPGIGRLIENYYVPLMLSVLELDDKEFAAEYPDERQMTPALRAWLAELIERHSLECRRCLLKASSDYAWDEYFNGIVEKKTDENESRILLHKRTSDEYSNETIEEETGEIGEMETEENSPRVLAHKHTTFG
ncbi:MAG TPA: hypothetical protein VGV38_22565, partial [Pyrinomonadaceae bacterium]|nr:hypothetical protein [Pyrinomonadaceae bacterium]